MWTLDDGGADVGADAMRKDGCPPGQVDNHHGRGCELPEADAGALAPDGGSPTDDAGTGSHDGGSPSDDAGTGSHDGGSSAGDAGSRDGGTATHDAGTMPLPDAGGSSSVPVLGIWTSAAELAGKPMTGSAWTRLKADADGDTSSPDVSNQDDPTNVRVLAAAIVYARTGDVAYKNKVIAACQAAMGTEVGGRSLAWARETGAYAMAADLVGYRTPAFEAWLHTVADVALCSQTGLTLRQMFHKRPNNWGTHAFGSLTAIDRYLGDTQKLAALRAYWVSEVSGPNPGCDYGETSWQADPNDLRLINPLGATKQGVNIDGIIPDDMRRGGSFTTGAPVFTGYPWENLQGQLMAARVLARAGMPIWSEGDSALYRAAYALQVRLGGVWVATGDDLWQLAFLDDAYGTSWSAGQSVYGAGKNTGYAYVLP